jgi:hypothetical protein
MSLAAGCPRCPTPVARIGEDGAWSCPDHGVVRPLWRPEEASYDGFVAHLERADGFPTYLPWPLSPGWQITDFAVVADDRGATASLTCVSGPSELDGPVDVLVIAEEAGVGLGARCAGTTGDDPGTELGDGPASARLRIGSQTVSLWPISTSGETGEWDRSVVVGEAAGRWLWLVLRPASAALALPQLGALVDVADLGPTLVSLPFGVGLSSW